ncbi:hypothetical protein G6F42_011924 [Rhizopus arrhizus]|nr:hypothetical protein G6F42_011924 [Rhizopus arrhizus]
MILEKKMTGVSQQLLNLPGGSMLSFSSQSTLNSAATSSSDEHSTKSNKPGFKKMFNMLKGNKKKNKSGSSDSIPSDTFIEPQRNSRMMMA